MKKAKGTNQPFEVFKLYDDCELFENEENNYQDLILKNQITRDQDEDVDTDDEIMSVN